MEWIALKHALLSHLPVATGLLLPWALFASQRAGRGIRPWWTVCRYLGWVGLLGLLAALVSGPAAGRLHGLVPAGRIFPLPASGLGADALLFRHAVIATSAALLALPALWAMNRSRKDHQSLGILALLLGLAWSAVLLFAGAGGYRLAHGDRIHTAGQVVAPAVVPVSTPIPQVAPDPEAMVPVRALDYATLEPMHLEP